MPRFTTLSQAINYQLTKQMPDVKMPDGSALHTYTGNTPLSPEYNVQKTNQVFRWGVSVWGIDNVTSEYQPTTR